MKQMKLTDVEAKKWPILEPMEVEGLPRPVAISRDVCVVGTRPEVELKLRSGMVSRTHAMFVADRDAIYLRDLASLNHTYVNEQPIREAVVHDGDVIGLGPLSFRCRSGFDRVSDGAEDHAPAAELMCVNDGTRVSLTSRRSVLIGSRDDCDVVLLGRGVEPSHAIIFERDGRRYIRDLRSVCGTWVNNQAVGQIELNDGDAIRIAQIELVYQHTPEAAPVEGEPEAELPIADEVVSENDDEQVELELADGTVDGIPESVGLSDWDTTHIVAEPSQRSALEETEEPASAPDDVSGGGTFSHEPVAAVSAAAERDVIAIRLDDLSEPVDAAHPGQQGRRDGGEKSPDGRGTFHSAAGRLGSTARGRPEFD
ncbi:MAG TPA: FHA domain-containing protein [Tepidisphaeraceae bacterium]|jgi:pSer/pThr/pTyr-binding forkhead associated (FHA) protein